ncbi:MAG: mannose-6-phosphate isomerase, partial [Novosphingobium sp.]|nr:mannose-6-phosphate isomerase [Novosphingobium sp.]
MRLLTTKIVEKPWGADVLPAQFDVPEGKRIG